MPSTDLVPTPPLAAAASEPGAQGIAAGALRLLALVPALGFLLTLLSPPLNQDAAAILDFATRRHPGQPQPRHDSLRREIRLSRLIFPASAVCRDPAALPSGGGDRGLPPAPARGLMASCKLRRRR
jgi:hypothetical protein